MTGRKVARADTAGRPFAGPLSPSSERQALVILNTLFAWLVNAGYLAGNPLSLSHQRARKAKPRVTRYLENDLWQAVKTSIDAMPRGTAREQEHYKPAIVDTMILLPSPMAAKRHRCCCRSVAPTGC